MGKKILLADDSITIQKVIELTFSDEDFDVITVGNGRLALERLPDVRPDIVLCDIIMPEKDGYEVCEQIKTNPSFAHIPVLLLTGAFEPFDQERAARAGYDGSLAKPFEPETLIAKVKDLLARAPVRTLAAPAPRPAPPPAVAAPSPVLPFQRPAPPPIPPPPIPVPAPLAAPSVPAFIPDEPFGALDDSAFGEEAPGGADTFAPMTEEESATLLAPPRAEDAASTVMFRAEDLPWGVPPATPPAEVPHPAAPQAAPEPAPVAAPAPMTLRPPAPETGPVFVPEAVEATEVVEEAVFEEVLEEDLEFGGTAFEPEPAAADDAQAVAFAPEETTLASIPPEEGGGFTGAFAALTIEEAALPPVEPVFEPPPAEEAPSVTAAFERTAALAAEPEPAAAETTLESGPAAELEAEFEPEPAAVFEPEPEFEPGPPPAFEAEPAPVFEPEPAPVFEPEPAPVFEPEPAPAFEPQLESIVTAPPQVVVEAGPARAPMPPTAPPLAPESFADVAAAVAEPAPVPPAPSEAAAVSVPVEMVEKIAQRVVAQISEKVVREIAWEVIPDLAEALIKQEIERLKAELQKT